MTIPSSISRIAAKELARAIQAEAKAAGRRLSYTQALADVAKRQGFANVHEMTASYGEAPLAPTLHPLIASLERHKGEILIMQRRAGEGLMSLIEEHFGKTGYAYVDASSIDPARLAIAPDLPMASLTSRLDAIIIDRFDSASPAVRRELTKDLADRKLMGRPVPAHTTIIVAFYGVTPGLPEELRHCGPLNFITPEPVRNLESPESWQIMGMTMDVAGPFADPTAPTEPELKAFFAETGESPDYPMVDWQTLVRHGTMTDGYWGWVAACYRRDGAEPVLARGPYKIGSYETGRYDGGVRVYDERRGFQDGKVKDFDGHHHPDAPQAFADRLNALHARGTKASMTIEHALVNGIPVEVLPAAPKCEPSDLRGLPVVPAGEISKEAAKLHFNIVTDAHIERAIAKAGGIGASVERIVNAIEEDGTSGQDREGYSDDQDRDSYSVED